MRLDFPTCNGTYVSYDQLAHVWARAMRAPYGEQIIFDFSRCLKLGPIGMVLLAGLYRILRGRGVPVWVDISTMDDSIYLRFVASGCAQHMLSGMPAPSGALFRHDLVDNHDSIIEFLKDEWLAPASLTMSPALRNAFISRLWEIYANAFEHGDSQYGVYTCGELASDKTLLLTVADFGRGIPANAASKLARQWVNGSDAMAWAFTRGTTTAVHERYARGLGLDLIKDFVKINDGAVEVYSHHGHGSVTRSIEEFRHLMFSISATIVHLKIRCDNMHYMFVEELSQELPVSGAPIF